MTDQTAKKDAGKPPMELLSAMALEGTAQVLAFGAKKYSANGWRTSETSLDTYYRSYLTAHVLGAGRRGPRS